MSIIQGNKRYNCYSVVTSEVVPHHNKNCLLYRDSLQWNPLNDDVGLYYITDFCIEQNHITACSTHQYILSAHWRIDPSTDQIKALQRFNQNSVVSGGNICIIWIYICKIIMSNGNGISAMIKAEWKKEKSNGVHNGSIWSFAFVLYTNNKGKKANTKHLCMSNLKIIW